VIAIMASVVVPKKLPICREKALGSGVRPLWGQMGSSAYPFGHQDQELCLLCAFDGPPRIVLHGRGDVVQIGDRGFC
jgi:hypothetical protein